MRAKAWTAILVAGAALSGMTGCADFFPKSTTTSTGTGSGTTSGDYAYVVNLSTNTLSGFAIGTGTLTAVSSTATSLVSSLAPTSVVVSRQNSYVYVGGNGAIVCYSIGSGGVVTAVSGGGTTVNGDVLSMATSPDGQWLLSLTLYGSTTQATVYGINTTTGVLAQQGQVISITVPINQGTVVPRMIRIAPSGNYAAIALGTGGDAFFTFTTATGALLQTGNVLTTLNNSGTAYSDNSVQFDSASARLFVGSTGPVAGSSVINSFPITTAGALGTAQQIASGDAPVSLEMDSTGAYLYAANTGSKNISGYTYSNGTLTAMASSPFGASLGVNALARDKSGTYLLAISGNGGSSGANDLTLYGFDAYTPGRLNSLAVAASGTDPAGSVAVATTH